MVTYWEFTQVTYAQKFRSMKRAALRETQFIPRKKVRRTALAQTQEIVRRELARMPTQPSPELKVYDIATATYQVNTSGSITLLANPVLGSDFNARIGRKIVLKSVYVRGHVVNEAALAVTTGVATAPQLARMIILTDLQPNGAVPTITDILVEAMSTSQLNMNNRDRFKIHCDKVWTLDNYVYDTVNACMAANNVIKPVKKFQRLQTEVIFNATNGATIADINSGALYMVWIGSAAAGANSDANARVSTRVRYLDA